MKQKSYPTEDVSNTVYVYIEGKRYKAASINEVVSWLVKRHAQDIRGLLQGHLKLIDKITTSNGEKISVSQVYNAVYNLCRRPKNPVRKKRRYDGYVRNYFNYRKERDPVDLDEPLVRNYEKRGQFAWDEGWDRKNERNWKSFRKTQYK